MNKKLNIAAAIAVITLLFSLSFVNFTSSLYFDSAVSKGNSFFATSLDFSLHDFSDVLISSPLFTDTNIAVGYSSVKNIRVKKDGVSNFKYIATFHKTAGDDVLCNALHLKAELGGITKYNGSLNDFTLVPEITIGPSGQDDWTLTLTLDNGESSIVNMSCNFELIFKGSQVISDGTWGYINEETITNTITSSSTASSAPNNLSPELNLPVIETEATQSAEVLPTPSEMLVTPDPTPELTSEPTPEITSEPTPEITSEPTPSVMPTEP